MKNTTTPGAPLGARYRATTGINVPHPTRKGRELRLEQGDAADRLTRKQIDALLALDPPALKLQEN